MRLETEAQKEKRRKRSKIKAIIALFSVVGVIAALAIVFLVSGLKISARNSEYDKKISELRQNIETQKERTTQLEERRDYMNSREYIEEVARNKMGLIYPDEIVFKAEE